jgi:hypothetical protein
MPTTEVVRRNRDQGVFARLRALLDVLLVHYRSPKHYVAVTTPVAVTIFFVVGGLVALPPVILVDQLWHCGLLPWVQG